jgi:hypothetical protein
MGGIETGNYVTVSTNYLKVPDDPKEYGLYNYDPN